MTEVARAGGADALNLGGLVSLAQSLRLGGRADDAVVLLEHVLALQPNHEDALSGLVKALGAKGLILEALDRLMVFKAIHADSESLPSIVREQSLAAVARYNVHLQAGEIEQAEKYASRLAALIPHGEPMLSAALACNQALGRGEEVVKYARALLAMNATHAAAKAALAEPQREPADTETETERRMALALSPENPLHPLVRLRDIHDVASSILCRPLTERGEAQIGRLLAAASAVIVGAPAGSEWEGWEKHYRLLLDAVDLTAVHDPTPAPSPDPEVEFMSSAGVPLAWDDVRATAARLGARVAFFAAADESYVELYARWYALSILKHCDVPCLVVMHVIGGIGRLDVIARSVGVQDERLVYAGDGFDAEAIAAKCYDAPPKGLIARPVAHYQSVRFLRLGALLQNLQTPVFVSDIDLLLQRGVQDLLERSADADVVFNENEASMNAGSRLTANLLLLNPTDDAALFLRFLRSYLELELAKPEVTRWIDQLALVMARHHLWRHGSSPRVEYFDTRTDINNVMYPSYQEHPFRFLSLYHGFDTSSLEGDPRVLGEEVKSAGRKKPPGGKSARASMPRGDASKSAAGRAKV